MHRLILHSIFLAASLRAGAAPSDDPTEAIVNRMMEMEAQTSRQLQHYTSMRRYSLENKRFSQRAEMTVRLTFRSPGHKVFEVLTEKGSTAIRSRVFRRLLDSEVESTTENMREASQITPRNYLFRIVGSEDLDGRKSHILTATPKTKNKFLFEGKIWVDAESCGIARIEGSPAQNPSIWIRKTSFIHRYGRFGPFWMALSNTSLTDALIFGRTEVRIEYYDYKINE